MSADVVSDEVMYERLLRGDVGAFDVLYERHSRPLFGFILRHLADREEAEDVLHDVFLAVLRERPSELRSVRAWVFDVARNQCLNRLRSRSRASRALKAAAVEPLVSAPAADDELGRFEATAALHHALGRLPPPLAELYRMRARGLSYEELARALAIPLGTVKSRMHELVVRLRQEMEHEL